jgi:P27 family predicted phage terminase small subunit
MAGNHNSGRRPHSTALKLLRGNPGKGRINAREPAVPPGDVRVPATISKDGRRVWERLAPIAIAMQTLTVADVEAFKTLCELQASLDLVSKAKNARDFVPFTVGDNGIVVHAALALELKIAPVVRPYYEKFGLEPVGRARLTVGPAAPASKWAALTGG